MKKKVIQLLGSMIMVFVLLVGCASKENSTENIFPKKETQGKKQHLIFEGSEITLEGLNEELAKIPLDTSMDDTIKQLDDLGVKYRIIEGVNEYDRMEYSVIKFSKQYDTASYYGTIDVPKNEKGTKARFLFDDYMMTGTIASPDESKIQDVLDLISSVEGDPNRVWIEEDCTLAEYMDGDHYKTYIIYNNALRAIEKSIEPYSNENISLNTEGN